MRTPFLYLLLDSRGRRVAGDLPVGAAKIGWSVIAAPEPSEPGEGSDEQTKVRAFGVRLGDGATLVVGRNTADLDDLA